MNMQRGLIFNLIGTYINSMKTIHISLPDNLSRIVKKDKTVLIEAMRHVATNRFKELKEELNEAEKAIKRYERRYKINFNSFEKQMKRGKFLGYKEHEDYNDWFFWTEVRKRNSELINKCKVFIN